MEVEAKKSYSFCNDISKADTLAIIVAAGYSSRMGGVNKLFCDLLGIPVIARTLLAYQRCDSIDGIVVATREESIPDLQKLCEQFGITKLVEIVKGGATRSESVKNAVDAADARFKYFAIADGARPLTSNDEIEKTLEAAMRFSAAACAVKVSDTIKLCDDSQFILSTPDRSKLWAAQTPQIFNAELYKSALSRFYGEYTDDCAMIEAAGVKVKLVEGSYKNIKITTPTDLIIAKAFLEEENL